MLYAFDLLPAAVCAERAEGVRRCGIIKTQVVRGHAVIAKCTFRTVDLKAKLVAGPGGDFRALNGTDRTIFQLHDHIGGVVYSDIDHGLSIHRGTLRKLNLRGRKHAVIFAAEHADKQIENV